MHSFPSVGPFGAAYVPSIDNPGLFTRPSSRAPDVGQRRAKKAASGATCGSPAVARPPPLSGFRPNVRSPSSSPSLEGHARSSTPSRACVPLSESAPSARSVDHRTSPCSFAAAPSEATLRASLATIFCQGDLWSSVVASGIRRNSVLSKRSNPRTAPFSKRPSE